MIDRFALSFLCIELDRNVRTGVTGLYILLTEREGRREGRERERQREIEIEREGERDDMR